MDEHSEDEANEEAEEEDWFFDCVCGVNGNNLVSNGSTTSCDLTCIILQL